jgi:hypothetical protein
MLDHAESGGSSTGISRDAVSAVYDWDEHARDHGPDGLVMGTLIACLGSCSRDDEGSTNDAAMDSKVGDGFSRDGAGDLAPTHDGHDGAGGSLDGRGVGGIGGAAGAGDTGGAAGAGGTGGTSDCSGVDSNLRNPLISCPSPCPSPCPTLRGVGPSARASRQREIEAPGRLHTANPRLRADVYRPIGQSRGPAAVVEQTGFSGP